MADFTLEQSIALLLSQVPEQIQRFVLYELSDTALDLMATHRLHVDQAEVLEKQLMLMLLGQVGPADFSKSLQDSGVSEETVRNIVTDINEQIFKKLRDKERNEAFQAVSYRSQPDHVSLPTPEIKPLAPAYAAPSTEKDTPAAQVQDDVAPGRLPILPGSMPPTPHPWQTSPARSFQTASVPYTSVPYVSQPVRTEPVRQPAQSQPVQPPAGYIPPQPPPAPVLPNQMSRDYAIDPYREPI